MTELKEQIVTAYLDLVGELKEFPSMSHFVKYDISRDNIRKEFGSTKMLRDYMIENFAAKINENITTIGSVFSSERNAGNVTDSFKRFIITTAVASSPVHEGFMKSLDNYAERLNAQVIIMPCESKTNSFNDESAVFDPIFSDPKYVFVQSDTAICSNMSLCSIQVSANQVKPITGLARLGKRSGSYVFASPKQFLEYYPNGNIKGRNYAIMTPGACTKPHYFTENFVSKRLAYIGEADHTIGAIIVEVEDDGIHFHFRQIQADDDGSFIDLGVNYLPDGSIEKVKAAVVLGDIHGVNADFDAIESFAKALTNHDIEVENLFLHDLFDGISINHHEQEIGAAAKRKMAGTSSLRDELVKTFKILVDLEDMFDPSHTFVVKSNHDEFIDRYLKEGRYINDPENYYTALKIAVAQFEGLDPLQYGMLHFGERVIDHDECVIDNDVTFLTRNDSVKVAGIELGAHGDLGYNGAKPSLNSMEITYGRCVIGHNHSGAIQRGVFRVGTMSKLDMKYNRGPSSWTPTNALVYPNGQVQLLNFVNGKYYA